MPYGDVRDYIKRSRGRALWALQKATRYRRTVDRLARDADRAELSEDGFIDENGYPTPRGETLVNVMSSYPKWKPGAPAAKGNT